MTATGGRGGWKVPPSSQQDWSPPLSCRNGESLCTSGFCSWKGPVPATLTLLTKSVLLPHFSGIRDEGECTRSWYVRLTVRVLQVKESYVGLSFFKWFPHSHKAHPGLLYPFYYSEPFLGRHRRNDSCPWVRLLI
jgi:hypothetical protein